MLRLKCFVLHTRCLAKLCLDGDKKDFCSLRARKKQQQTAELMFSLYCLPSLCGTLNQIVWVSELGGLYRFIEGNSGEAKSWR